jgi:hypothetical protein
LGVGGPTARSVVGDGNAGDVNPARGLYAPMIRPWSGTPESKKPDGTVEDPQYLYWNLSLWASTT